MDNSRMSTADMLQYCNEALAWEEFGPVDIFFFESVKKILLGQCSAMEEPEEIIEDLMGIERPVSSDELAPDYDKYADEYYYEEGEQSFEESVEARAESGAFEAQIFSEGFFNENESSEQTEGAAAAETSEKQQDGDSFTVNV